MPHKKKIIVAGKQIEMVWHGPSPDKAPTLIFLHEGLGCAAMWRDFPARLAQATGCGALVYSRWGYGGSDPCALPRPIHFMHDEALKTLPQLIAATGIRKCILIGHSDGGSIAIIYAGGAGAAAAPLLGVITEAAHLFCEEKTVRSIEKTSGMFRQGDFRRKLAAYHGDNVDVAFWGWNRVWLHPDFMTWNIEEYLPGIRVPMLAIQGVSDEYGSLAQVEAMVNGSGGDVETALLEDCGHNPHRDQLELSLRAMTDFVFRVMMNCEL